ncbi:MAG: hypothetical protein IJX19_08750, partial [Clostridia bacterium]|nr:hypothetical protein [Clostridia bacterium]
YKEERIMKAMKSLMRLVGIALTLLLLFTASACTNEQMDEVDEKSRQEETMVQETPEAFDYVLLLNENNHLVLKKNNDVDVDIDFTYIWSGNSSDIVLLSSSLGPVLDRLTHTCEETIAFLHHYFEKPVSLRKISYEERAFPEDHRQIFFYKCSNPEDGSSIFEFCVLADGSLQFIDSQNNTYVSEKGMFER